MKNWEDVVAFLQKKDLIGKDFCFPKKEEEKETHTLVWVLAIIGAVASISLYDSRLFR